jgi:hypothetical protein
MKNDPFSLKSLLELKAKLAFSNISFNLVVRIVEYVVYFVSLVTLLHDTWCWKDKTLEIEVKSSDVTNVDFTQTGYILKCTISHEIILVGELF